MGDVPVEIVAFRHFLRSEGLKCTPEREEVLAEAFATHDHFEAEGLLLRIRRRGGRVSRATVYRTLALLVRSGLLRHVSLEERPGRYEHTLGHEHHDHLICLGCGRVIEFTHPTLQAFQRQVCQEHRFTPKRFTLEITGYCEDCGKALQANVQRADFF